MRWLALAIGAFLVMVYALLHCSLTKEQALIIIGLSSISVIGVFNCVTRYMTLKLQLLRATLEALAAESAERSAVLEELRAKVKIGVD